MSAEDGEHAQRSSSPRHAFTCTLVPKLNTPPRLWACIRMLTLRVSDEVDQENDLVNHLERAHEWTDFSSFLEEVSGGFQLCLSLFLIR